MNYTVPEMLHPKYRGCVWALKCLISFQLLYILWNQSWNVLIAQSAAALFADLSRKNKNKKISSRSVVSHLSRCWSVAKSRWQVFVLLAAFCSWTEMQLHMKTLLWRWILKWHSSHYVKSNITQCRGSILASSRACWMQHYLIGILIQHDHNLGHVIQLTDHFHVVHGPLPLLIFGLLQKDSPQAADMKNENKEQN